MSMVAGIMHIRQAVGLFRSYLAEANTDLEYVLPNDEVTIMIRRRGSVANLVILNSKSKSGTQRPYHSEFD